MMTKGKALIGSLLALALAYVFANPVFFRICINTYTFGSQIGCLDKFSESAASLLVSISLPLLLLSLITYKMREEVFRAWWGFARWWVPVIIVVTLLLQNAGGGGGIGIGGAVSGAFDVLFLGIFYAILVITSLVKIVRAYLKTKGSQ